jgi:hypothetical protein
MANHSALYTNTSFNLLTVPAVYTASQNSATLDTQNYDDVVIGFNIGASGDTLSSGNKLCLEVQESADNVTWTACADSALTNFTDTNAANTGTVAALIANGQCSATYFTGYIGFQRYVRGVLNFVGTHTNGVAADVFGDMSRARQAQVNPTPSFP